MDRVYPGRQDQFFYLDDTGPEGEGEDEQEDERGVSTGWLVGGRICRVSPGCPENCQATEEHRSGEEGCG